MKSGIRRALLLLSALGTAGPMLAVTTAQRIAMLPDVPTTPEQA